MELTIRLLGTGLHDIEVKQQKGKTRATNIPDAVSNIILPSPEKWRKLLCNWVAIQAGSQESVLIQVRMPHFVPEF